VKDRAGWRESVTLEEFFTLVSCTQFQNNITGYSSPVYSRDGVTSYAHVQSAIHGVGARKYINDGR